MSATGSLILDSSARGILDNNTLYGTTENILATGSSNLNGLSSSATAFVVNPQTAQASLGAITSIASSGVAHFVQGATNLGGLSSSASAVATKVAQAQSLLGSLIATIEALPEVDVTAVSELGALVANADATSPNPPEPDQHYGSRYGYYQVQNKKKPEPIEIKPTIVNFEFEPLEPLIKTIFATSQTNLFGLSTMAQSRIDFSTEQDDLDLLMIL